MTCILKEKQYSYDDSGALLKFLSEREQCSIQKSPCGGVQLGGGSRAYSEHIGGITYPIWAGNILRSFRRSKWDMTKKKDVLIMLSLLLLTQLRTEIFPKQTIIFSFSSIFIQDLPEALTTKTFRGEGTEMPRDNPPLIHWCHLLW